MDYMAYMDLDFHCPRNTVKLNHSDYMDYMDLDVTVREIP